MQAKLLSKSGLHLPCRRAISVRSDCLVVALEANQGEAVFRVAYPWPQVLDIPIVLLSCMLLAPEVALSEAEVVSVQS